MASVLNEEQTRAFLLKAIDSALHKILFPEAPQISIPSVPASYNEGTSVNISCRASGTPDPDVQWIRNGTVKSSGKKTAFLMFSSINRADGGQYTCRANNSVGSAENHTALVVHCKYCLLITDIYERMTSM